MLQKFEITGLHVTVDDPLRKYITRKLGHLDRYIPKRHRESAHMEIRLKEAKHSGRQECTCEVTLRLPHETITVTEATINMYAAVDIVETKLKQQIQKYKDAHANGKLRRHLFRRFRNSPA